MTSSFRKIVFLILLVGISAFGYKYLIKDANKDLADQKSKVDAKMAQLSKFEKATEAAEDITKQLEKLEEAIAFFESKLPPSSQIHNVLKQVTLIAQKQGLKAKTIRTLQTKDNSGYIEQPLKMQLEGDFSSFYSFLLEIEKLPRIMKFRELNLKKQNTDEGQISADFIVSIFFQHQIS